MYHVCIYIYHHIVLVISVISHSHQGESQPHGHPLEGHQGSARGSVEPPVPARGSIGEVSSWCEPSVN